MTDLSLVPVRSRYRKPSLKMLGAHDGALSSSSPASSATFSAMDLLRVVQSSLDKLGLPRDQNLIELKLRVLEEVSAGRLANALNVAILRSATVAADAAVLAAQDASKSCATSDRRSKNPELQLSVTQIYGGPADIIENFNE